MDRYILITGGNFKNKGAEALTYTVVSEMKRRFPDCRCVLIVRKAPPESDIENYSFDVISQPGIMGIVGTRIEVLLTSKLRHIFANACALIDISGYRMSTSFPPFTQIRYLNMMHIANARNIPIYLMPQSFGPFNYKGIFKWIIKGGIAREFPKADCIMVREEAGQKELADIIRSDNIIKTHDLILQSAPITPEFVFKQIPEVKRIDIDTNSVALVPNTKLKSVIGEDQMCRLYSRAIDALIRNDKKVYLIFHSTSDKELCLKLKEKYKSTHSVILVDELTCLDYSANVSKFDFIVASRYHSIIFAYKNSVPAVLIGWAEKYKELSAAFEQSNYFIDSRANDYIDLVDNKIDCLSKNFKHEGNIIHERLTIIEKENLFDTISLKDIYS